jgi:hypothetical protein
MTSEEEKEANITPFTVFGEQFARALKKLSPQEQEELFNEFESATMTGNNTVDDHDGRGPDGYHCHQKCKRF